MMIRAPFRTRLLALVVVAAAALVSFTASTKADAGRPHATQAKLVVKRVKVVDDAFVPGKLTIKVGQAVDFVWSDNNYDSHNVTLLTAPKGVKKRTFTSVTGTTGIHFQRTFTVAGAYHFYCTIHSSVMNFFLTVTK